MRKRNRKTVLFQWIMAIIIAITLPMTASAKVTYEKEQVVYMTSKFHQVPSQTGVVVNCTKSGEKIRKATVKMSDASVAEVLTLIRSTNKSQMQSFFDSAQSGTTSAYGYQMDILLHKPGKTNLSFKVGKKKHTIELKVKAYTNPIKKLTITGVNEGKNIASKFAYVNQCTDLMVYKKTGKAAISVTANKNWKIESVGFVDSKSGNAYSYMKNGSPTKSKVKLSVGTLCPGRRYEIGIRLRHKNGGVINCAVVLQ